MDTEQINKILWGNEITRPFYVGCYPCDRLPTVSEFPRTVVANLDPTSKQGTHWVALFYKSPALLYYFDSLGSPPNKCLLTGLKGSKIVYNTEIYQNPLSNRCAHHVISFIYNLCAGIMLEDYLIKLSSSGNSDNFVFNVVKSLIIQE
jgi:hypothetical protein